MTTMRWARSLAAGAAILAGATPVDGQNVLRFAGDDVAIYNLVGRMEVVRGTTSDIVVRVTTRGADGDRLTTEMGEIRGRQTLRVIYPESEIVYPEMGRGSNMTTSVRPDGTFGDGANRNGDRVRIRGRGDGMEAWAELVVEVPAGRTVSTYVGVGDIEASGVSGTLRLDVGAGGLTATDVTGSLIADTGSGSVNVRGVDGDLRVDTGSGSVDVSGVSGGEVSLDTGSGRVQASNIEAARFAVDTGSGRVSLTDIRSPVVLVDTGSGSVEIDLLTDVDQLDVDTGSGSVTVRAPEGLGGTVELDTGSGGIDLDFPLEVTSVRRDRVVGRLGDGQGTIRIDTGSGGIRLVRRTTQLQ